MAPATARWLQESGFQRRARHRHAVSRRRARRGGPAAELDVPIALPRRHGAGVGAEDVPHQHVEREHRVHAPAQSTRGCPSARRWRRSCRGAALAARTARAGGRRCAAGARRVGARTAAGAERSPLCPECAANTWYAIGAARLRQGDDDGARAAFRESLRRVPAHPMARAALGRTPTTLSLADGGIARAVTCAGRADREGYDAAAATIERALLEAPAGNAGWLLPVEPMLNISDRPGPWAGALARLRTRAA